MSLDIRGAISRGAAEAETMIEENKLPGGKFDKINWFKLPNKGKVLVRFLFDHDEWFNVMQHPFAPTRPKPSDMKPGDSWPESMSPVCRKTPQFLQFFPDGCYICDHMHEVRPNPRAKKAPYRYFSQVRIWDIGVEREEIRATNAEEAARFGVPVGAVAGYRDVLVEVEETNDSGATVKVMRPKILVFNQPMKNFFGPLQGYGAAYGTLLDRDYLIERKGEGVDTDYNIIPMNPVLKADGTPKNWKTEPEIVDGKETGRVYRDAYLDHAPDLIDVIQERLDDEFYDRFFDDRKPQPVREQRNDSGPGGAQGTSSQPSSSSQGAMEMTSVPQAEAVSNDAAKEKLAAMRARVGKDNPTSSQPLNGSASQESAPSEPAGMVDFN